MARLGHGIGESLLIVCLGQVPGLKLKLKLNWNYIKIEFTWKWKYDLKNIFKVNL